MTLRVIPSNDSRNQVQKELDEAIKAYHANMGSAITGFVLICWPADKSDAVSCYNCGQIDPDFLSEYVKQTLDHHMLSDALEYIPE